MKIRELSVSGAWEITPVLHGDPRGLFLEWFRVDKFAAEIGRPFTLAQANLSVSAKGVVRGMHFADVPPGQAKYVSCVRGAVLDVVVDIRVGSPTFGQWDSVVLDDIDRRTIFIEEGLGHGFCALTDDANLAYLCSETYNPTGERAVHPLDPEIGIAWPAEVPKLSVRDEAAPTLAEALAAGVLPDYHRCQEFTAGLSR